MGRPLQFDNRKQLSFSVGKEDFEWILGQAGGNVSGWCRERVLHGKDSDSGTVVIERSEEVREVVEREPVGAGKRKSKGKGASGNPKIACIHGTKKGNYCWQCGGKAKIDKEDKK